MEAKAMVVTEFTTVPGTNIRGMVQHFGDDRVRIEVDFAADMASVLVCSVVKVTERGLTIVEYERLQEQAWETWKQLKGLANKN